MTVLSWFCIQLTFLFVLLLYGEQTSAALECVYVASDVLNLLLQNCLQQPVFLAGRKVCASMVQSWRCRWCFGCHDTCNGCNVNWLRVGGLSASWGEMSLWQRKHSNHFKTQCMSSVEAMLIHRRYKHWKKNGQGWWLCLHWMEIFHFSFGKVLVCLLCAWK